MDVVVYDKIGKESNRLENLLLATFPQKTITDVPIVSFADGADDIPIKQLSVAIEPVQDLHGQDAPYPAGGGVNKIAISDGIDFTLNNVRYYVSGGKLYLNGTSSGETSSANAAFQSNFKFTLKAGSYYFNRGSNVPTNLYHYVDGTAQTLVENAGTFTLSQDEQVFFGFYIYNKTFSNEQMPVQIVEGSTAPSSYSPYSNICPISGHTECNVTRCGKNLFDVNSVTTGKLIGHGTGSITSNSSYLISDYIPVKAGNTYQYGEFNIWYHTLYDNNKNVISDLAITNATSAMIPNGNAKYIRISCEISKASTAFFSDTSTEYHPYQGTTYPITFPSGTGTVYGGNITVNQDGSGSLVVDKAEIQVLPNNPYLGWLDAYDGVRISIADMRCDADDPSTVVFSNIFDVNTIRGATNNTGNTFVIKTYTNKSDSSYLFMCGTFTSLNEFKTWAQDKEIIIVYSLATPLAPIPLTASQITTLLGTNNIWADTGNISLTYRANLGDYINNAITTAVANALNV